MKTKIIYLSMILIVMAIIFILFSIAIPTQMDNKNMLQKNQIALLPNRGLIEEKANYKPGEIVVKFKSKVINDQIRDCIKTKKEIKSIVMQSTTELQSFFTKFNVSEIHPLCPAILKSNIEPHLWGVSEITKNDLQTKRAELATLVVIKLTDKEIESDAIKELSSLDCVEYAELNLIYTVNIIPNDPYYQSSGSWGQDYDDLYGIKNIGCESAWDIANGSGIVTAVIDTGIDYDHEDIAMNTWVNSGEIQNNGIDDDGNGYIDDVQGWDFYSNDNNPMDDHGHGTHVSGTIAAAGNNNLGVIGVAYNSKVMAVKALNNKGEGDEVSLVNGILYAADNGARVINCSWGAPGKSQAIEDAIQYAHDAGCIVVVSAGNSNAPVKYFCPANIKEVTRVAAIDYQDAKANFSNYGPEIDVSAPGVDILSLRAKGTDMYGDGSHIVDEKYYRSDGTSMAAPHVAGVVALILSHNPTLTNTNVETILKNSCDDIGDMEYDEQTGYGRCNAFNAMDYNSVLYLEITSLDNYALVAKPIDISGTITGNNLVSWNLDIKNINQSEWSTLASGTNKIIDGVITYGFNSNNLQDGTYWLRLSADDGSHTFSIYRYIYINNSFIVPPIKLTEGALFETPNHADIDNDGQDEILLQAQGSIFAYKINGNCVPGFPINVIDAILNNTENVAYIGSISDISIDDMNNDNSLEIVVSVHYTKNTERRVRTMIFGSKGNLVSIGEEIVLELSWFQYYAYSPILKDIDKDGKKEIISGLTSFNYDHIDEKGHIVILDNNGNLRKLIYFAGKPVSYPCIGDVNGDGNFEIATMEVSLLPNSGFHVFDCNGNELSWSPKSVIPKNSVALWPSNPPNRIIIGDIDRNSRDDAILQYSWIESLSPGIGYSEISCYSRDGTVIDPKYKIEAHEEQVNSKNIILGDFIGDKKPEICFQTNNGTKLLSSDGTITTINIRSNTLPIIADINQDNSSELIIAQNNGSIFAFNYYGELLEGWPKTIYPNLNEGKLHGSTIVYGGMGYSPLVFCTDGKIILAEICMNNDYEISLNLLLLGEYSEKPEFEWPMLQHDPQHTGRYIPVKNNPPIIIGFKNISIKEGQLGTLQINAFDPDNDNVTLTCSSNNSFSGNKFEFKQTSNNPAQGIFRWIPNYDQAGEYKFVISASDFSKTSTQEFTVTVLNTNRPPIVAIEGIQINSLVPYRKICYVGEKTVLIINASDNDGDVITEFSPKFYGQVPNNYTFTEMPLDPKYPKLIRKYFSWTPTENQIGTYKLKFYAFDGSLYGTSKDIFLEARQKSTQNKISIKK